LSAIRRRIDQACQRSGRPPESVTLVCVTKGVPVARIREVLELGVGDLGENRVQEAQQKHHVLSARREGASVHAESSHQHPASIIHHPVKWHLIGHLQRNKARDAVELFDVIHSVDSVRLAEELERHAARKEQGARSKGRGVEVLVQVNVSSEATKFGCAPDETGALARAIMQLPHLRLRGLMTMAQFTDHPEEARPHFRRLRELRDALQASVTHSSLVTHHSSLVLSMGMSQDFEVAIEEGADLVRIGSAIFGDRRLETGDWRLEK